MDVLILENITMLVGMLLAFLAVVVFGMVLHTYRTQIAFILAPLVATLKHAAYVERTPPQASMQTDTAYRHAPDIDAEIPTSICDVHTSMIPDETALIQHLARLTKPSGDYWLTANKLYAAMGGDRNVVMATIRAARGQAEPVAAETHQFEHTGKHQSFARTGVKPLR